MYMLHKNELQQSIIHDKGCLTVHPKDIRDFECTVCRKKEWGAMSSRYSFIHETHFYIVGDFYYHIPIEHPLCRNLFELTPEIYL